MSISAKTLPPIVSIERRGSRGEAPLVVSRLELASRQFNHFRFAAQSRGIGGITSLLVVTPTDYVAGIQSVVTLGVRCPMKRLAVAKASDCQD